ncbi:hypothetical protein CAEBREN_31567 [Caenorhabditis brenneri]|uniref:Nuclear receptor domain-containing protein n=1 Tax=Caenorhabditis brenneri TaxID=135651 RepID=G0P9Q4_CAEBE|nr:hypothetical protein CAEBREN_31567 [Caenorhabditis brenneri]
MPDPPAVYPSAPPPVQPGYNPRPAGGQSYPSGPQGPPPYGSGGQYPNSYPQQPAGVPTSSHTTVIVRDGGGYGGGGYGGYGGGVDRSIRCACRYCRFEKCLKIGMDRSALQASRDRIGYTKRTRKPKSSSFSSSSSMSPSSYSIESPGYAQKAFETYWSYVASRERASNELRLTDYLPKRSLKEALCSKSLLNDPIFLSKHAIVSPRHSYTELRFITQNDYHYWHERDWFVLTEYAKTFKVFDALDYADKHHSSVMLQ